MSTSSPDSEAGATMSQPGRFHRNLSIHYWWECAQIEGEIPETLQNLLDETAHQAICRQMASGYVSGALSDTIQLKIPGVETPSGGFECNGGFEIQSNPNTFSVMVEDNANGAIHVGDIQDSRLTPSEIVRLWNEWTDAMMASNQPVGSESDFLRWLSSNGCGHLVNGGVVVVSW